MTVSEAMKWTLSSINQITPDAEFEAKELVCKAMGIDKTRLALSPDENLSSRQIHNLKTYVIKRKRGTPLQYIIGKWEFYSLPMYVGKGVLIPRQDTETLVDTALDFAKKITNPLIFDLCSGSGAIAIALENNLPGSSVYAVENSRKATHYLKKNIELNSSNVVPFLADAVTWLPPENAKANIITCNPPYIPTEEIPTLSKEVRKEPIVALDGGEDGLLFYRIFIRRGRHLLKNDGKIIFEVGENQAEEVLDILAVTGYKEVGSIKDLNGITRVVYGTLKHFRYDKI